MKLAYTVNEALAALGIGRTKFYQLAREGKIDLRKLGTRTIATAASLERLIDEAEPATDRLSDKQMLGPFFKEYADLGHWFNAAHDRCIHCNTPTIDLFEDGIYGEIRKCSEQ